MGLFGKDPAKYCFILYTKYSKTLLSPPSRFSHTIELWKRTFTCCILHVDPWRLHPVVMEDINELVSEGGNVLSDLHDVIFSDAGLVPGSLLRCHVAADQDPHHSLVLLTCLLAGFVLVRSTVTFYCFICWEDGTCKEILHILLQILVTSIVFCKICCALSADDLIFYQMEWSGGVR